ncbi:MAG: response regulator [Calditrichia bacterium]|nr:response regulator [Calditrichia bacterium]MCK5453576.1 response regulator [Calditrichia bacterium]
MSDIKRLLIVDDEEALTFSLYQIFINVKMECEVLTASSGNEALTKIEQGEFDLVITDIAMPGINGLDLLSIIKGKHPMTKVIIITAYGSDENKDQAYQRGAEKYIEKPFDLFEIRDLVIDLIS